MGRLIDADALIRELKVRYPSMPLFKSLREEWAIKTEGYIEAEKIIMTAPTVDAVEVVRCKDCKHCHYEQEDDIYHCHKLFHRFYDTEHYCSYGERRDRE